MDVVTNRQISRHYSHNEETFPKVVFASGVSKPPLIFIEVGIKVNSEACGNIA